MESEAWGFWKEAVALRGAATLRVLPNVAAIGLFSFIIYGIDRIEHVDLRLPVGPHEVAGFVLGLILVMRTNAGYDRWWEARKAWGGIVNQSRALALAGLSYGPDDPSWRRQFVAWTAAFPHASRACLRDERVVPELVPLLGAEDAARVASAQHMPSYVVLRIAALLDRAVRDGGMGPMAFLRADEEKTKLIDHIGVCERIKKTPLAKVFAIKVRRIIVLFLLTLPLALLHKFTTGAPVLVPLLTMLVAYPVLGLDQIGVELQDPFSTHRLSHLPLDDICRTIETNVLALLESAPGTPAADETLPHRDNSRPFGGTPTGRASGPIL